uniref:ATP-dependent DNA helicase n=1 Tax=Romanomermis culicivorax TaxID=13658 RepID=A0A915JT44_ROMCU
MLDPVLQKLHKDQIDEDPEEPDYALLNENQKAVMNAEQRECFDQVSRTVLDSQDPKYDGQRLFLLHGSGGTGKTFVYNSLITWAKSQGWAVIACASTGIAARLLINGHTAHSTFGISNE